jgi:hypothetical protein
VYRFINAWLLLAAEVRITKLVCLATPDCVIGWVVNIDLEVLSNEVVVRDHVPVLPL